MRKNKAKLEKAVTSKEFRIFWLALDPYGDEMYNKNYEPNPNHCGNYRRLNDCKSWKNYRKRQWKILTKK
jgi:hypothetical protein